MSEPSDERVEVTAEKVRRWKLRIICPECEHDDDVELPQDLQDHINAANARAERAAAATAVFRRELQRRQDSSFDPITQDNLDSDAAAIGQPLLDRAAQLEQDNARLRRWLVVAHDMIGDWLVDADAYHSLTDPSEEWLQALREALTAAAEGTNDD